MPHLLHNNDELDKLYPPLSAPEDLDDNRQEMADLDDTTLQVGQAIAARIAQQAADFGRRRTPQNDGPSPRSEASSAHDNDGPLPRRASASDCPSVACRPVARSREVPSAHDSDGPSPRSKAPSAHDSDRSLPRRSAASDCPSVACRPVTRSCEVSSIDYNTTNQPATRTALTARKELYALRDAVRL